MLNLKKFQPNIWTGDHRFIKQKPILNRVPPSMIHKFNGRELLDKFYKKKRRNREEWSENKTCSHSNSVWQTIKHSCMHARTRHAIPNMHMRKRSRCKWCNILYVFFSHPLVHNHLKQTIYFDLFAMGSRK